MNTFASFAAVASVATSLVLPAPAFAQFRQGSGAVGLTIFSDPDFRGESTTLREDVTNFQFIGLNDQVSSLRVGRNEVWEVCEHANYQGRCRVFSGFESDLRSEGWNDRISSARRIRDTGRGGGRGGRGTLPGAGPQIELYSDVRFGGDRRVFSDEVSNLQFVDFNDRARSLRIRSRGSWQVCADANFQNCIVVNADSFDLGQMGMARRISSLRPWRQTRD